MKWMHVIPFLAFSFLGSCFKQAGNYPPVIESIMLDPNGNHTPGSDIGVSAMVNDKDGDPLVYFWNVNEGQIINPDHPATTWVLTKDSEPLSYESITLTVSDGKESVSKTETIQVSEGLLMSGYTFFTGTTIPIPDVEITIGNFSAISDEKGFYLIEHLKEGNAAVRASKSGFDDFESMVYVDHPKSTYNITLHSPVKTQPVFGTIKTIDDITYEGLKIVLLNPDGSESMLEGVSDENGHFHIASVPVGSRELLIRNDASETHFLSDSLIHQIELDQSGKSYDARIKIKRLLLSDYYMSESERWIFDGVSSEGFYLLGKGQQMALKDFIWVPQDAENVMLFLNSYVVGGCNLIGDLPSHRVWISNLDQEYLGGISWGGEGSNYSAEVSWSPADSPTFMNIYGKEIKLHLEISQENSCVPNPVWRIFQTEFSYYF